MGKKSVQTKPAPLLQKAGTAGFSQRIFATIFGAFFGLCLLKFGNPPITEKWVEAPSNPYEFVLGFPWPIAWAFLLLSFVCLLGVLTFWRCFCESQSRSGGGLSESERRPPGLRVQTVQSPAGQEVCGAQARKSAISEAICRCSFLANRRWLVLLPLAWLLWQCVSATHTLNAELTYATLGHFAACVVCFYLGFFLLRGSGSLPAFWTGIVCGLVLVILSGWEQHFGGLEETRKYFELYVRPRVTDLPHELIARMSTNRIFGTLFYPNALAGALLLLLPGCLSYLLAQRRFTPAARVFLAVAVGCGGAACLYWSGSKAGWLLMLFLGLVALMRVPFRRHYKIALIVMVLLAGSAGFLWKYSTYLRKGATSVVARFDYWRAALQTIKANPVLGTGPGTFYYAYERVRSPEMEPARLTHNDYLQQGSDSGLPGFLIYAVFIVAALIACRPTSSGNGVESSPSPLGRGLGEGNLQSPHQLPVHGQGPETERVVQATVQPAPIPTPAEQGGWPVFCVWLGLLGWCLQSIVEFGLYIPALAWPAFALFGCLVRRNRTLDTDSAPR
jgi:O-antigen ligase